MRELVRELGDAVHALVVRLLLLGQHVALRPVVLRLRDRHVATSSSSIFEWQFLNFPLGCLLVNGRFSGAQSQRVSENCWADEINAL